MIAKSWFREHIALLSCLFVLAVLYSLTIPTEITLEDAGIFQMTCHLGGISHPPGYPLFTGICQAIVFGDSPLVGNAISTVFALAAVATLYFVVLEIGQDRLTALFAATSYGVTRCLWSQALIIEVYSFAAFLFLLCWWLLLRFSNTQNLRYWYGASFCAGLAISNHWPLFILSCLGFVSLIGSFPFVSLLRLRTLLISIVLVLLGLTPYLLLFVEAPQIAMYGQVTSENFISYFLREYYSDNHVGARFDDKVQYLIWMLPLTASQLGWLAAPVILLGAVLSSKRFSLANYISLLVIYLSSTFLLVWLLNFRFEFQTRAVFQPYPVIAMSSIAVFFAVGLRWLVRQLNQFRTIYAVVAAVVVYGSIISSNFLAVDRSSSRLASEYADVILATLPANALLLVGGDNQIGPLGFTSRVKEVRPDVWVQSVEGLLFRDNLIPRKTSNHLKLEKLMVFSEATSRRVFSTSQLTTEDVDYGLFYEVKGKGGKHVILPEVARFAGYLVKLDKNRLLQDSHEIVFSHSLLVSVTRLFSEYAMRVGTDAMSDTELLLFQQLQQTLPGKLSSFRTLVFANPQTDGLLELGLALEAQLDRSIAAQHDALVFEFIGRVLLASGDRERARNYFYKSLAKYPASHNLAICEYFDLSDQEQRNAAQEAYDLEAQNCIKAQG